MTRVHFTPASEPDWASLVNYLQEIHATGFTADNIVPSPDKMADYTGTYKCDIIFSRYAGTDKIYREVYTAALRHGFVATSRLGTPLIKAGEQRAE